jgi:hypothetical protein
MLDGSGIRLAGQISLYDVGVWKLDGCGRSDSIFVMGRELHGYPWWMGTAWKERCDACRCGGTLARCAVADTW